MLVCGDVIHRMGSITGATTVSDYHESERQRKISVQASLLHTEWLGKKFNIIDTPGYLDFISEALGPLRVGDFALVVIHAQHGFGIGTERVWEYATGFGIPNILEQTRRPNACPDFPLTIPINPGPEFNQVLDVLRNEVVTYAKAQSGKY